MRRLTLLLALCDRTYLTRQGLLRRPAISKKMRPIDSRARPALAQLGRGALAPPSGRARGGRRGTLLGGRVHLPRRRRRREHRGSTRRRAAAPPRRSRSLLSLPRCRSRGVARGGLDDTAELHHVSARRPAARPQRRRWWRRRRWRRRRRADGAHAAGLDDFFGGARPRRRCRRRRRRRRQYPHDEPPPPTEAQQMAEGNSRGARAECVDVRALALLFIFSASSAILSCR